LQFGLEVLTGDYEEYGVLGCNAVLFEKGTTFGRNIWLLSTKSKNNPSKKQSVSRWRGYVPLKRRWTFIKLHSVTLQNIVIFMVLYYSKNSYKLNFINFEKYYLLRCNAV
jgi:hypothetical protein